MWQWLTRRSPEPGAGLDQAGFLLGIPEHQKPKINQSWEPLKMERAAQSQLPGWFPPTWSSTQTSLPRMDPPPLAQALPGTEVGFKSHSWLSGQHWVPRESPSPAVPVSPAVSAVATRGQQRPNPSPSSRGDKAKPAPVAPAGPAQPQTGSSEEPRYPCSGFQRR